MSAPFRPGIAEPLMVVAWDVADDPMLAGEALLAWMFPAERVALIAAAIRTLEPEAAAAICDAYLAERRAGEPIPALFGLDEEAAMWAADASPAEQDAYFAAIWAVMPRNSRRDFIAAAGAV